MVYNSTMVFVGDTLVVFLGFMKQHHWGRHDLRSAVYGYMMIMMGAFCQLSLGLDGVSRDIT